jgi:hypothetical protein
MARRNYVGDDWQEHRATANDLTCMVRAMNGLYCRVSLTTLLEIRHSSGRIRLPPVRGPVWSPWELNIVA